MFLEHIEASESVSEDKFEGATVAEGSSGESGIDVRLDADVLLLLIGLSGVKNVGEDGKETD